MKKLSLIYNFYRNSLNDIFGFVRYLIAKVIKFNLIIIITIILLLILYKILTINLFSSVLGVVISIIAAVMFEGYRSYRKFSENNKIVLKKNKDIFITFLTTHASKWLGFDEVIIINALNCKKGFPSKKENDPIISIFDSKDKNNKINFPEERRLFYVALTRTKNKVYIISPKNNPSEFITEIRKEKSVIERFNTI